MAHVSVKLAGKEWDVTLSLVSVRMEGSAEMELFVNALMALRGTTVKLIH